MQLDKAHPSLRSRLRWIPPVAFHNPLMRKLVVMLMQLIPEFKGNDKVKVRYVDHDQVQSKIYQPGNGGSGAAILWIHGGGYLFGHPKQDDMICRNFVESLAVTVVSVNYRHAPAHPFPAPLEDCHSAWLWLQSNVAELQIDPQRIVIAGQSAGGGLAAALTQKLHDGSGIKPAGQALLCPMLDDRTALQTSLDAQRHFIWNNKNNRGAWHCYLGQEAGLSEVPNYAVPARRKDLVGLPATWIGVGAIDLFHEEDIHYATRMKQQGVDCELHVTEGAPHAFESIFYDSELAAAYWQSNFSFLRRVLNLDTDQQSAKA